MSIGSPVLPSPIAPTEPKIVSAAHLARAAVLPVKPDITTPPLHSAEAAPISCLSGRFVELHPFVSATHTAPVVAAFCGDPYLGHPAFDPHEAVFKYMRGFPTHGSGPIRDILAAYANVLVEWPDAQLFVVTLKETGAVIGVNAFLANRPKDLVIEIGAVSFTPAFQGTPANTEATYLLLRWAFDVGYRRVEWKANNINERSKLAALRIGFTFEGVFRQHMIVSDNQSRDTAWFSMIDEEWPAKEAALEAWLASDAPLKLFEKRKQALKTLRGES